jgi:16S rRNA (guanine527-N7)-methyltransferase
VLLVESIRKKALFLETAVDALGLGDRVTVAASRAEDLAMAGVEREQHDVVTARAVATLSELVELAFPLLRVGGRLVAWKREPRIEDVAAGRPPLEAEVTAGRNAARALGGVVAIEPVALPALADHRLVIVTKGRPTPSRFPRPPAERHGHPL